MPPTSSQAMRREYTVEEFSRVVDSLTAAVADMHIATDIICGFPGGRDGGGSGSWHVMLACLGVWMKFACHSLPRFVCRFIFVDVLE